MENRNELRNRMGKITMGLESLMNSSQTQLESFYSVFYPMDIQTTHNSSFYGMVTLFGYSPYFEEIAEGEMIPEYTAWFKREEVNGVAMFDRFEKVVKP